MMALRAHSRGGPETLVYETAPVPVAAAGEVLVEVHAAAITFTELDWDETWRSEDGRDRTPIIPSHEVSGVVVGLGDGVDRFAIGDEVYGRIGFNRNGAAAEYAAVPVADLALRPLSVSHVESATIPLAALTAWQALADHAELRPGEHVVVLGGAGGVGAFAVQLARHFGATVSATARGTDLDFVLGLGADVVLDYLNANENNLLDPADVLIDAVGGPARERAIRLVRPGGRFVTFSQPVDDALTGGRDLRTYFFIVEANEPELATIASLVDSGELRPTVARVYPLSEGRAAYAEGARLHGPGKTVLRVR
ncbi:NADP-dependent oxidoreductase [Lacisediminihabitans profunda]|uniref:NADP-dependent oxidoreductase n=1 Tax=Lacisediminihabitans profunda TaxID=2594790 RepID=A0A5C8URC8_9MICO|nr:NADP-dependent oxidoreductase [Lacisediminihabitans profunda]TXN30110.1 NADP-dependent oxidoreductase [Lacisediminihabitans profunda]